MKIARVFASLLLFASFSAHAIKPCEGHLLDPRVDWSAVNEPHVLPQPPLGTLNPVEIRSTARQGGVWMVDQAGTVWMVKPDNYFQELTASAEVISSLIYSHFGVHTPKTTKVWIDGKAFAAVRSVGKGLDESLLLYMHTRKWRAMRFVAAYLKDWDRIHTGPNNFIIGQSDFLSYDFGGTLGARAGGRHKPGDVFSEAVGAYGPATFEQMYNGLKLTDPTDPHRLDPKTPDIPLPTWHPWNRLDKDDLRFALKGFQSLTDDDIRAYVVFAAYSNAKDEDFLISTLIHNRDVFIEGIQVMLKEMPLLLKSAGIVVYRRHAETGELQVLLRKVRGGYGGYNWSFAKGRMDPGEDIATAAKREVFEELGVTSTIEKFLVDATGDKTTSRYFIGQVIGDVDLSFSGPETERIEWFNVSEAREKLNRPRDQVVLDHFVAISKPSLL